MTHDQKRAASFDTVAMLYDQVRPGYPAELYQNISRLKALGSDSTILEIGAGHGIATQEILNHFGCSVLAIEPGSQLCDRIRARLPQHPKLSIHNGTFEDFRTSDHYDIIISATAFHWIKKSIKYSLSHDLLKNDGLLVLYWNNYSIQDPQLYDRIQLVYSRYGFSTLNGKTVLEMQAEKIANRRHELANSGLFTVIDESTYDHSLPYTADSYSKLLQTFSDHSTNQNSKMDQFYQDISHIIAANGNCIDINVHLNCLVAAKKSQPFSGRALEHI